jgi:hypothetical protein
MGSDRRSFDCVLTKCCKPTSLRCGGFGEEGDSEDVVAGRRAGREADFSTALLTMRLCAASVEMTVLIGRGDTDNSKGKATADPFGKTTRKAKARQQQIPSGRQQEKQRQGNSRSLRDDNKKSKGKATADPFGMTTRKAKAKATADPFGMTTRKAKARQQQIPSG